MIPKECKRLAEVDFPIAVVSKHSAREKSIRHGHPSTLHLWWARRPLAACRAILLGLLLPDPCDPHCPEDFEIKARDLLPKVQGKIGPKDEDLRQALLKFIGDFSNWDLSSNQTYLEVSRGLVKAAHPEETPLVVDPFAGGGSIPLEALRLGCETFASDLNPVACLILKVMLEDIPRHGPELASELRRVGKEIKEAAEKELKEFYPTDPDGSTPIAYLWARTVRCESPNCGAEIPLVRSFWLCKKPNRKRALRYKVIPSSTLPSAAKGEGRFRRPTVKLEIFEPKGDGKVQSGTVTRAKGTCLCCGSVLPPERVRAQLADQRGGADVIFDQKGSRIGGALLLAIVRLVSGEQGRHYRLATERDYEAIWKVQKRLRAILHEWDKGGRNGLCPVPDEPLPWRNGHRSIQSPRAYGMNAWGDYFSSRQKVSLEVLSNAVAHVSDSQRELSVRDLSGLLLSKFAELACANSRWEPVAECPRSIFTRHDLPATWDFAEGVPISSSSGGFAQTLQNVLNTLDKTGSNWNCGQVQQADARQSPLPADSASVWFTDPPYYDAVAYADLSDFFFVWLKRALHQQNMLRDRWDSNNPLVPKEQELTVTTLARNGGKPKTNEDFERGICNSFAQGTNVLSGNGIGCVVFAHKTTEGWEALLTGMLNAGWVIRTSWPIATEMAHRFNARDVAALATSVHLVCRPRPKGAPVGDWGDVLRELPKRVGDWMERLQSEGIRGADLVFACIGPALEIFSRYSKVVDAEEREIPLGGDPEASEPHRRGFLSYVWEVVGRTALEQVLGTPEARARNSTAGALEEDARLTALFLWTLQSTNGESPSPQPSPTEGRGNFRGSSPAEGRGSKSEEEEEDEEEETPKKKKQGYSLIFDVVRRFAQPLGIHLPEWEGRVIETDKGVVRLLSVKERTKQLFGEESASVVGFRIEEQARRDPQMKFDFAISGERAIPELKPRRPKKKKELSADLPAKGLAQAGSSPKAGVTTTLDRVHAAMLLQASGQTNALRALLKAEQDRGPDFLRLANALSALYPKQSEEKRLLDAMLLAMPR